MLHVVNSLNTESHTASSSIPAYSSLLQHTGLGMKQDGEMHVILYELSLTSDLRFISTISQETHPGQNFLEA